MSVSNVWNVESSNFESTESLKTLDILFIYLKVLEGWNFEMLTNSHRLIHVRAFKVQSSNCQSFKVAYRDIWNCQRFERPILQIFKNKKEIAHTFKFWNVCPNADCKRPGVWKKSFEQNESLEVRTCSNVESLNITLGRMFERFKAWILNV